jgi:hypothetical protein
VISQMNRDIRRRLSGWAAILTAVAVCAVLPETVDQAVAGRLEPKAAWFLLTGFFGVLAWIVEGFDIGRQTRHRREIDSQIVTDVIGAACPNPACPAVSTPGPQTREVALALFYELIDIPSREVAFRNWGWYYTSVQGTWIASIALACAFAGAALRPVDHEVYRGLAFICLVVALLGTALPEHTWIRKTRSHLSMQLVQVRPKISRQKVGADCQLGPLCQSK